jgi:hypothetical protein
MGGATKESLVCDDSPAGELDVIGMCAKSQQWQKVSLRFRYRLHLNGQPDRG